VRNARAILVLLLVFAAAGCGKKGAPLPPLLRIPAAVGHAIAIRVENDVFVRFTVPTTLPAPSRSRTAAEDVEQLPGPLVAPTDSGAPTRYYYAVGVSANRRYGPTGAMLPVPLGPTSAAPGRPEVTYDAENLTIRWTPAPDARGVGLQSAPDALPSKPIFAPPAATTYDLYEVAVASNQTPSMPTPLTPAPLGALQVSGPIGAFGVERCFFVRSVDIVDGYHVRGPASPTVCVTPKDTFPPRPPRSLAAVATEVGINLIWEPSESADLAGYIVLRSRLPDDTLQPASEQPITGTTFVDKGVRPDVAYAYVVIAVDKAGNRSEPSNRVEETARQ
jgi:hypothetical protein